MNFISAWRLGTRKFARAGAFSTPAQAIDAHYHPVSRSDREMGDRDISGSMIEGVINAEDCIASGVTSVRDCGCRHEGIYTLQAAIAVDAVVGPDTVAAGRNPTGPSAPRHWRNVVGDGPDGIHPVDTHLTERLN